MSDICYPDSLIGSIPNLYYYAANNPSEATIAKRRSYANTISYLTPPAENAGLYKGLKVFGVRERCRLRAGAGVGVRGRLRARVRNRIERHFLMLSLSFPDAFCLRS